MILSRWGFHMSTFIYLQVFVHIALADIDPDCKDPSKEHSCYPPFWRLQRGLWKIFILFMQWSEMLEWEQIILRIRSLQLWDVRKSISPYLVSNSFFRISISEFRDNHLLCYKALETLRLKSEPWSNKEPEKWHTNCDRGKWDSWKWIKELDKEE